MGQEPGKRPMERPSGIVSVGSRYAHNRTGRSSLGLPATYPAFAFLTSRSDHGAWLGTVTIRQKITICDQPYIDLLPILHRLSGSEHMENAMTILDTLTLSPVTKKAENDTPHLALRRKMVAALDEQIAGARAELAGQHYRAMVTIASANSHMGFFHEFRVS